MTDSNLPDFPDDPRPVFPGHWPTATGKEKGDHSQRVREWKERHGLLPEQQVPDAAKVSGSGSGAGDGEHDRDAHNLRTLRAIQSDPKTLPSDRIRSVEAEQRILNRLQVQQAEEAYGPLRELHAALSAVPQPERVALCTQLLSVEGTAAMPDAQGHRLEEETLERTRAEG